jgi:ribonucleoside-diphosphate reductase alpha chain
MNSKIVPNFSKNALIIASKRYLKVDKKGEPVETPQQMFERISKFMIKAETDLSDKKKGYKVPDDKKLAKIQSDFYEIQANLEFLSGMPLLDRGKEDVVAACYVMPIKDSLESIYGTLAQTVILHRRGAGVGYDFSEVRPEGSVVKSTGREASGPISFMRLYDFSSEVIMNRGAVRHAGHMGILNIGHPDIEKFITAKHDYSQLTNFNISVAITDQFIKALKEDTFFPLTHDGKIYKKVNPNELLDLIVNSIYKSGEPGFIFIDEINRHNPTLNVGRMTATNQCGEQPLLPYEACNLGSIVLNKFVIDTKLNDKTDPANKIDWKRMEFVVRTATRFLDNTVTITRHLLPQIEQIVKYGNRKIGLGVMGWADLLYLLEIPYNSDEALALAEKIMKFIREISHDESQKLGRERGDFGNFKGSLWQAKGYKHMRNATVTTIAPNGTTSLLADCNGGIEPFFALGYSRKNMETMGDTELVYVNKYLEKKLKDEWLYDKQTMKEIVAKGTLAGIKQIPARIKKVFVTAFDIDPSWHIKAQAAFQKHTDNAVSKTINFPESATKNDIKKAFFLASDLKLKGMTIYRDKSRDQQVLNLNK